jgi:hypothetical protein
MNKETGKEVWVVPRLEKIEMAQTRAVVGGCSETNSKHMSGAEDPNNCAAAS